VLLDDFAQLVGFSRELATGIPYRDEIRNGCFVVRRIVDTMPIFGTACNLLPLPVSSDASSGGPLVASAFSSQADDDMFASIPAGTETVHYEPAVPTNLDSMLTQELMNTSMYDRKRALFDLHGILAENDPPTEQDIDVKVEEVKACLAKDPKRSMALDIVETTWKEYVHNRDFLISFLRADGWDPLLASKRINRHFQFKGDLFGMEKLGKDITQDDLSSEGRDALFSGLTQLLPLRDRAGRVVHASLYHPDSISLQAKLECTFYMAMVCSEDTETQRRGNVAIGYLAGQGVTTRPCNDLQVGWLLHALPIRFEAVHLCHDAVALWNPIFSVLKRVLTLFLRMRLRIHFGSHVECQSILQTFGIPHHTFPLSYDDQGNLVLQTKHHDDFWKRRADWERALSQGQGSQATSLSFRIAPTEMELEYARQGAGEVDEACPKQHHAAADADSDMCIVDASLPEKSSLTIQNDHRKGNGTPLSGSPFTSMVSHSFGPATWVFGIAVYVGNLSQSYSRRTSSISPLPT